MTFHFRALSLFVLCAGVIAALQMCGCASRASVSSRPEQLPPEIERAVAKGDFAEARNILKTVRDSLVGTPLGADAQFRLSYLNVFYGNSFPDWDTARSEFGVFIDTYPKDERVEQAQAWHRALTALVYAQNPKNKPDSLKNNSLSVRQTVSNNAYETLIDALQRCASQRDSLVVRVKLLQEVIEAIEKSR